VIEKSKGVSGVAARERGLETGPGGEKQGNDWEEKLGGKRVKSQGNSPKHGGWWSRRGNQQRRRQTPPAI